MSYCRWSSCNWACDLYVYEDVAGCWTIHVAASRVLGDVPKVDWPTDQSPEAIDRCVVTHNAQMEFLATADRETITLAHAGESFHEPSPLACAERIEQLQALGYRVPDGVAQTLREEAAA